MLVKQRCLLAEGLFQVECHQAAEKGFFSWRALKNSRKHTLRETSFICYANLETRDLPQTPGFLLALAPCLWSWVPVLSVYGLTGEGVSVVSYSSPL